MYECFEWIAWILYYNAIYRNTTKYLVIRSITIKIAILPAQKTKCHTIITYFYHICVFILPYFLVVLSLISCVYSNSSNFTTESFILFFFKLKFLRRILHLVQINNVFFLFKLFICFPWSSGYFYNVIKAQSLHGEEKNCLNSIFMMTVCVFLR